jgi:protoheme IX farnesyltransferase
VPREKIRGWQAWIIVLVEFFAGSILLLIGAGIKALLLGWLAMFWYNLVYTGLKKKTPHAVIAGSVIGAIPPLVGWVAAERSLIGWEPLAMAVFFFTWQVPHFYLLAAKYGREYERAGFPALTSRHTIRQIKKSVFFWVVLTAMTAAGFSMSRTDGSAWSNMVISSISLLLVTGFVRLLRAGDQPFPAGRYFMRINYYVLLVLLVILADPLL